MPNKDPEQKRKYDRDRMRAVRAKDPERTKEVRRSYYEAHRDRAREVSAAHYAANKEQLRARQKQRRQSEEVKAREAYLARQRRAADPEKYRDYRREYRQRTGQRRNEQERLWYLANIEQQRLRLRARYWGDPRLAEVAHMVTKLKEEIRDYGNR